jgi:hypothetical protein
MSEPNTPPQASECESPPPTPRPPTPTDDRRTRLHELAQSLMHSPSRQHLQEYLTLRRALR